jgi:hypothetical protein
MPDRSQLLRLAGLLAAAGLLTASACSQQPQANPAPAAAPSAIGAGSAAGTEAGAGAAAAGQLPPATFPAPPDGKWLVDEQGHRYFVDKIPKEEGAYIWLNEEKTRVQVRYGGSYDIVGHDDTSFHIKVYAVEPVERPSAGPGKPTPEELEKVAESYRNGTGTADRLRFEAFSSGLPKRGQWRNGFEIADMNGDGHPDIVHGPERKGTRKPNIFLGDGKGNWRLWSEVRYPPLPYDYGDVAVADFNGDGRLDLALGVHLAGVIALVADGPASFKEWGRGLDFHRSGARGADQPVFSSRALAAADMNGDGRPDLVALGEGPRLMQGPAPGGGRQTPPGGYGTVVYLNQGDGSWVRRPETGRDVQIFGDKVAVADFTHDGKPDIILGSNVRGEQDILRIGDGNGSSTPARLESVRRGFVGAVEVADFNRDGRLDLAVGYLASEQQVWRTGIDLFLGRGDGTWERRPLAVEENRGWLTALDSGDLDGDGNLDLAALTGEGRTWVLLGKGDGAFLREETPEIPQAAGGCRGYDLEIADLDGEPGEEMVTEFAGEPSAMFAPDQCVDEGEMAAWKPRRK